MGFLGAARLQVAPPLKMQAINQSSPHCEYWRGAVCGLIVTNNRFDCTPGDCAYLDHSEFAMESARQVHVGTNHFEDESLALCTQKHDCSSKADCAGLLGTCGGTSNPIGAVAKLQSYE